MTKPEPPEEPDLDYQVMSDLNREPLTPVQQGVVIATPVAGLCISFSCFLIVFVEDRAPTLSPSIFHGTIISVFGIFFLGTYLMYHRFAVHRAYLIAWYILFGFEVFGIVSIIKAWK